MAADILEHGTVVVTVSCLEMDYGGGFFVLIFFSLL